MTLKGNIASVCVISAALYSLNAMAGSQSFENTFTSVVCSNGWVGCVVDGDDITIDSNTDSRGMVHSASSRVSFFDFEPLLGHSPFEIVDQYPKVVVEVPEPVKEVEVQPAPTTKPKPKTESTYVPEPIDPIPTVVPEPEIVPEPEVIPEPEPIVEVVPEPDPDLSQEGCDDLMLLEGSAMMGELDAAAKSCLETKIAGGIPLTQKRDVSLLLINNAEASRNMSEWSKLVGRHLKKFDQSDPVVCMRYAYYLSKKGVGSATKVIKWSEVALANKHQWSGTEFKKNVNALYGMRASAANQLWTNAEKKLVDNNTPANKEKAENFRGQSKNFAKEWLDYARASSQPTKSAMSLCVSATQGDVGFCK